MSDQIAQADAADAAELAHFGPAHPVSSPSATWCIPSAVLTNARALPEEGTIRITLANAPPP